MSLMSTQNSWPRTIRTRSVRQRTTNSRPWRTLQGFMGKVYLTSL
jgi:hypothetical protein